MRISDWSSDVCSSDLGTGRARGKKCHAAVPEQAAHWGRGPGRIPIGPPCGWRPERTHAIFRGAAKGRTGSTRRAEPDRRRTAERKSVASGKSGSVRGDLGGRRKINTKKQKTKDKQ